MPEKKHKILVVEDDKFLLKFYSSHLKKKGLDVILAENGEEGLEKVKTEKPDLVLLDLILPRKGGFEILQEIKADQKTKDIPVIIFSNLGQDSDKEKCKELGAADYLVKVNLDIKDVMEKINKYLS